MAPSPPLNRLPISPSVGFAPRTRHSPHPSRRWIRCFARDSEGNLVVLFQTQWSIKSFGERNSAFDISDVPFSQDSIKELTR